MATIDKTALEKSLKAKQLTSFSALARISGLHRNTINHYLRGNTVFQHGFEIICQSLNASPFDLIQKQKNKPDLDEIADLIDRLHAEFPELTFVLFGSRARGREKKYSDWDIGFFSSQPISHRQHLNLLKLKNTWLETSKIVVAVDLVNFNNADTEFLNACKNDFIFLTGKLVDWHKLTK